MDQTDNEVMLVSGWWWSILYFFAWSSLSFYWVIIITEWRNALRSWCDAAQWMKRKKIEAVSMLSRQIWKTIKFISPKRTTNNSQRHSPSITSLLQNPLRVSSTSSQPSHWSTMFLKATTVPYLLTVKLVVGRLIPWWEVTRARKLKVLFPEPSNK